jgi:two-component system cell cycle response regulator DivK
MIPANDTTCILIAEDLPTSVRLFTDVLTVKGYRVVSVLDGREVFAAVEAHKPDLIIMDIGLPGISGITLTKQIRAHDALKHIPILAATAFSMSEDLVTINASGVTKTMVKPFGIFDLLREVAELLPARKNFFYAPEGE